MVRLVKGAYWDTEIKRAQVEGSAGYPVFTRKVHTDVSYLACARKLIAAPMRSTRSSRATTLPRSRPSSPAGDRELRVPVPARDGRELYDQVRRRTLAPCRIYAPVGSHETSSRTSCGASSRTAPTGRSSTGSSIASVGFDRLIDDPWRAENDGGVRTAHPTARGALSGSREFAGCRSRRRAVLGGLQRGARMKWRRADRRRSWRHHTIRPRRFARPSNPQPRRPRRSRRHRGRVRRPTSRRDGDGPRGRCAHGQAPPAADARAASTAWPTCSRKRDDALWRSPCARRERPRQCHRRSARGDRFPSLLRAQARAELAERGRSGRWWHFRPWNFPLAYFTGEVAGGARRRQPSPGETCWSRHR